MFYDSSNKPWLGPCVIITIFITMDYQLNTINKPLIQLLIPTAYQIEPQ